MIFIPTKLRTNACTHNVTDNPGTVSKIPSAPVNFMVRKLYGLKAPHI